MHIPRSLRLAALACALIGSSAAHAEMVLSKVIVDLQPGQPSHDDIEVWNASAERMYVAAEPSVIRNPGLPNETRETNPDPAVTGLLVSPQRIVLEPDERRIIRISELFPRDESERVYRVRIRPVSGPVEADKTALKVLIGYDALVLFRPTSVYGNITATRAGRHLIIRNDSNVAQEIFGGKQCDATEKVCKDLTAIRLYPGATLAQDLPYETTVRYKATYGKGVKDLEF